MEGVALTHQSGTLSHTALGDCVAPALPTSNMKTSSNHVKF